MSNRLLSRHIKYPFVPGTASTAPISGILDMRVYIKGFKAASTDSATKYKQYYMGLKSIAVSPASSIYNFQACLYYGVPEERFIYNLYVTALRNSTSNIEVASSSSPTDTDIQMTMFYTPRLLCPASGSYTVNPPDYEVEPCRIIWMERVVNRVIFANEERRQLPDDRLNLTNTIEYDKVASGHDTLRIYSGYNMGVGFNSDVLHLGGSPGNGLGLAPDNMWDNTLSTSESDTIHLKSINGVIPDDNGNIPFEVSKSLKMTNTPGVLQIDRSL